MPLKNLTHTAEHSPISAEGEGGEEQNDAVGIALEAAERHRNEVERGRSRNFGIPCQAAFTVRSGNSVHFQLSF